MTPEDEAFNEIERRSIAKKEAVRAQLDKLESQEPVAWIDLQKEAQQIVESKSLWKRFIVGSPLANDIACWMADFALQHHPPQRTWVGLTPEEFHEACWESYVDPVTGECSTGDREYAVRWTEAKLKEKNT
jgi:hypothetical protein